MKVKAKGEPKRERAEIEQDLLECGQRITGLCGALRDGSPREVLVNLPGALKSSASELHRLADELSAVL
jgi:hypothetical protein